MIRLHASTLVLALALGCAPSASESPPPAPAVSAEPEDINARFLDPELDVAEFTEMFEGESREVSRSREGIAAAVGLAPGTAVADVGAGTGLFLEAFARRVGPSGRVYAVEISPRFREHLAARAREKGIAERVSVVAATESSSGLAQGSVDVAFVCDTYHHFDQPAETLASLFDALRPGGSLVIVDFERIPGKTSDWILKHVRAGKDEVIREVEAAGFRFERQVAVEGLRDNYMLRFARP
jgi:predicted methyltransferase